jgi:hypothetical protein
MFQVEKNIPIPSNRSRKGEEKEELSKVLILLKDGESVFVEHEVIGITSVRPIVKEIRAKTPDRKFVVKVQVEPIKGVRIWAKYYKPQTK